MALSIFFYFQSFLGMNKKTFDSSNGKTTSGSQVEGMAATCMKFYGDTAPLLDFVTAKWFLPSEVVDDQKLDTQFF